MMNSFGEILSKLPTGISGVLSGLPANILDSLEEVRMRAGQEIIIVSGGKEYKISLRNRLKVDNALLSTILNNMMNHSYYAYEEELAKGYITIQGGHRVGVCGRTVVEGGEVKLIKDISSLNIRRSKEIKGVCEPCMEHILDKESAIRNTIIVSPPKCGKTTLLRDIVRELSYKGYKMGVCDERSEIGGMYLGVPSFDLGPNTDILDGCPKDKGIIMLIRSMAPDIIATDEIGREEDVYAIEAALCAGIGLITTIHGSNMEEILQSKIGSLIKNGVFTSIIFLGNHPSTGTIQEVHHI